MRTNDYNCPCCGSSFDSEALEAMQPVGGQDSIEFALPETSFNAEEAAQS